jgi:hypothetical protein
MKKLEILRELADGIPDITIAWAHNMLMRARGIMLVPILWTDWSRRDRAERKWLDDLDEEYRRRD